jgi:hypothetical protein
LFAEIHQKQSGGVVEAVVPNTKKEADAMVGSMNWQMPAFIKHYFVTRLVVAACCPMLVGEINTVTWDAEVLDLITAEDADDDACLSSFEKTNWFIDIDKLCVSPKKKKSYTTPEALFLLDEASLVTTLLHAKNDNKCAAARAEVDGWDSGEEDNDLDSPSGERENIGKLSQGLAADKAGGNGDKAISWSPTSSHPWGSGERIVRTSYPSSTTTGGAQRQASSGLCNVPAGSRRVD